MFYRFPKVVNNFEVLYSNSNLLIICAFFVCPSTEGNLGLNVQGEIKCLSKKALAKTDLAEKVMEIILITAEAAEVLLIFANQDHLFGLILDRIRGDEVGKKWI